MSESNAESAPNPFNQYCNLLDQRAGLYDALNSGAIVDQAVATVYAEEITAINAELDDLMVSDGFTDEVVAAGLAAETALQQLDNPVLLQRRTSEQLASVRQPILQRLENAASFLHEFATPSPNTLRIEAAARKAGILLVDRVGLLTYPPELDDNAGGSGKQEEEVVMVAESTPESPLDRYLSLRDAGLLASIISRFPDVLDSNGIASPDGSILELLLAALPPEEWQTERAKVIVTERINALDRITESLADAERLDQAIGDSEDDPRRFLLNYLRATLTSSKRVAIFQELVRAERALTIVVTTPSRSGPMVKEVKSDPVVVTKGGEQPLSVRPSPVMMPRRRTLPELPQPAVESRAAANEALPKTEIAAEPEPIVLANVDHLVVRLNEADKILAQLCLVRLSEFRAAAIHNKLAVDGNEAYPTSFLGDMLGYSTLTSAVKEAREDRVLGMRTSSPREITVDEALRAILYSSPVLKGFINRNDKLIGHILEAIRNNK